ncbi:MAG TPA: zinc ribbon domain-containing protein [Chthoniobacterales bacterium]|nr:zinc ribbon domain-containing protein [Chthoniobacterales bacterium]
MIKLVCPECRRENEPERIYCHDCGARLDRTALAKIAPKGEDAKETQKRLRTMLDPQRAKIRHLFFKTSKMILGALATAAVIQMILPPDMPPRLKTGDFPPQITLDMENALLNHSAAPLQYTEAQVNAYLGSALKSKQTALSKLLQFERAIVKFDENVCAITAERSLFGFSLFTTTSSKVSLQNGTLNTTNNGGSIGRLPVHPMLMKYADPLFSDLWTALDRERKAISKMGAIEFRPQAVVLTPKS